MRRRRSTLACAIACAIACALLVACGDDDASPTDAGTRADAGSDAGDFGDAGSSDGGPSDAGGCTTRIATTFGPEGGTLTHCDGAQLIVPAGALTGPAEVSIRRVDDDVPALFAPYVLAGPVFEFAAPSAVFSASVDVVLPHDGAARIEMAELTPEGWMGVEACEVTETTIRQSFRTLGTFAAIRDPNPYPDQLGGVGEGRIEFTFAGASDAIDVDPEGHAIDEDPSAGRRVLTLLFRRSDEVSLEQVDLRFAIETDGTLEPVQIQHADTSVSEIWGADVLAWPGDLRITLTRDEGGILEGSIDATLHRGEETRPFTATFTARPENYRYPPELVCEGFPEG